MKNEKGQISFEFIIVLVVVFMIFLFSLFIFSERNEGFIYSREQFEAKFLAKTLAETINNVFLSGNGTETKITLRQYIDYNVSISDNAIIVEWREGGQYVDSPLITNNIIINSLNLGGNINIKNQNGVVIIENS